MKIRVVKSEVNDKGKYKLLKVTYRNLETSKVMSANLPSFKSPVVFKTFSEAAADSVWDVKIEKNGDFYEWVEAVAAEAPVVVEQKAEAPAAPVRKGYTTERDFETKAERAARQILIVRQSSMSAALNKVENIKSAFKLAEEIEAWVLRGFQAKLSGTSGEDTPLDVEKAMKEVLAMESDQV